MERLARLAMIYGRSNEKRMKVAEMKTLRWMSGVNRKDRIRNEVIRGTLKVTSVSNKVQEARLGWFGHVARREDENLERQIMGMEVERYRKRRRPKIRWKDCIVADSKRKNIDMGVVENRAR